MAPLSLKSFSCIYFIRTSAYRQMKRPKHREEQMILRMWILRMWGRKHTAMRKESLSENAEAAEDSQWVRSLEKVCVECCDAKLCCFASPI